MYQEMRLRVGESMGVGTGTFNKNNIYLNFKGRKRDSRLKRDYNSQKTLGE